MSEASYQYGYSSVLPFRFDAKGKPCGNGYISAGKECRVGKGASLKSPDDYYDEDSGELKKIPPGITHFKAKDIKKSYDFTAEQYTQASIKHKPKDNPYLKNRPKGYYTEDWTPEDEDQVLGDWLHEYKNHRLTTKEIDALQKERTTIVYLSQESKKQKAKKKSWLW